MTSQKPKKRGKWTVEEDALLTKAVEENGPKNWKKIATMVPGKTYVQCLHRWQKVLNPELVKGPWTEEEDRKVIELVKIYGLKKWKIVASFLPGRIGKQCRERWTNHLDPNIKKGNWEPYEDDLIIEHQAKLGNKWAAIAKLLPGRTDNAIKNRFNSTLSRRLKKQKEGKSSNSTKEDKGTTPATKSDTHKEDKEKSIPAPKLNEKTETKQDNSKEVAPLNPPNTIKKNETPCIPINKESKTDVSSTNTITPKIINAQPVNSISKSLISDPFIKIENIDSGGVKRKRSSDSLDNRKVKIARTQSYENNTNNNNTESNNVITDTILQDNNNIEEMGDMMNNNDSSYIFNFYLPNSNYCFNYNYQDVNSFQDIAFNTDDFYQDMGEINIDNDFFKFDEDLLNVEYS